MYFSEDEDPALIAKGMAILSNLLSTNDVIKGDAVALVIGNQCDDELMAAFCHGESEHEAAITLTVLKSALRKELNDAINTKWISNPKMVQSELAAVTIMSNNQPHELGTVAELAAMFKVSKSQIRKLKQSGELEAFIKDNS